MLIDVVRTESWEELNDELKHNLKLESSVRLRSYYGLGQAVYEISQGSAHFMSHKKAIGVVTGQTGVFDCHLPFYYKEAYVIQAIKHFDMTNVRDWVESLKKDTNFVIFSEDHPVTGQRYSFVEELDIELNKKRIGSYRISHANHFYSPIEIRPYSVRICSVNPTAAIALLGERYKAPPLTVQNMDWNILAFKQSMFEETHSKRQNQSAVLNLEKQISTIGHSLLGSNQNRLFDRAVCVFSDVNATALANTIMSKIGWSSTEGWKKLATTNLCYWSTLRLFNQWWLPAPSVNELRGLLVFGVEAVENDQISEIIFESHQELLEQQSWSP
jgi:hypothetical protein